MVSQKSNLLSCCAHLKRYGQKRGKEEITQVCIGSYKLSQGQNLGKASFIPCCITLSRTIPMAPVYLQGRLGHVMLPTCRHSSIIGEYLANFCHIIHLSYPDTHLTSSQTMKTPTSFPSGGQHKGHPTPGFSPYPGSAWSFPACKTASPSLSSYFPRTTQPTCVTQVLFANPFPRAH